ncbi:hypothetical protein [Henriciella pelagia]|uniref:Uncharacterized protein n=2 Tax=Hyphomonadaceae TaxID=69657 RepID=A0ABQ1JAL1_9PROT|nr:hypothetical protein [Henriciella pelagia]GGB64146.1 hypothetical protein GCM10011503_11170 [Henriciella pelagia]
MKLNLMMAGIAAGLLATACTSGATTQTAARAPAGTVVAITPEVRAEIIRQGHDPDEEICKREEQMGSTIPKRVCATRAAWAAKTQASQEGTAEIQRNALRTRAPGAGGD